MIKIKEQTPWPSVLKQVLSIRFVHDAGLKNKVPDRFQFGEKNYPASVVLGLHEFTER